MQVNVVSGIAIVQKAIVTLAGGERRNVLIINNSLFSRNRSKKVELLACVYDRVRGTYVKGACSRLVVAMGICPIYEDVPAIVCMM